MEQLEIPNRDEAINIRKQARDGADLSELGSNGSFPYKIVSASNEDIHDFNKAIISDTFVGQVAGIVSVGERHFVVRILERQPIETKSD